MKPNIIFYFSDQQRADTCGCYGQKLNISPNLDELAKEGLQFQWAFSPQPVCGPCRAIFQTGKYPTETGCFRNNIMLPQGQKTLANYMEDLGYVTAYIGKWHLASDGDSQGNHSQDFSKSAVPLEYRGGYTGYWRASDVLEFTSHGYDGYVFDENNNRIDFKGYRADCITDMALEFFDSYNKEKPFFMTLSHIEPHHQNDRKHYEGPIGSKKKYAEFDIPKDLAFLEGDYMEEYPDYLGACASVDKNLGRLIQRLKQEDIYDNTVIIYSSDHGSHFKTRNKDEHLIGADDYKRSCHDSSIRVPLIISGGAIKSTKLVEDIVSTASIPKTILYLAGLDVGNDMIGENLLSLAEGKSPNRLNEAFVQMSESRVGRCIRTPEYTYAVYAPNINGFEQEAAEVYADDFLYDLKEDPNQIRNLIKEENYSKAKENLRKRLLYWIEKEEGISPKIVDSI